MAEPTRITVPGGKRGFNGRLTHHDSSIDVRVDSFTVGLRITSREAHAAQHKVFYPYRVSTGGFELVLTHKTRAERDRFNRWVRQYMERVTTNKISHGDMRVAIPARRFSRRGVPQGTLEYGDSLENQAGQPYTTRLRFLSASDPADRWEASQFEHSEDWKDAMHFYPSGIQLSGPGTLERTIFDVPPPRGTGVARPNRLV